MLDEQAEKRKLLAMLGKVAAWVFGVVFVLWAVLAMLPYYFASHPTTSQRLAHQKALDALRVANLQEIRVRLYIYSSTHAATFPPSLDTLVPALSKATSADPETGVPFVYKPAPDGKSFILCAKLDGAPDGGPSTDATFSGGTYCVVSMTQH